MTKLNDEFAKKNGEESDFYFTYLLAYQYLSGGVHLKLNVIGAWYEEGETIELNASETPENVY